MIDEKYLMKVLENWSEYWGKKSDGYSRLKWIMTIRFKALIKNFTKIGEWIPCSERLPEEPEELPTENDFIEEMILDGKFKEYNVTIYGAEKATTLYYIGNGEWYDEVSGEYYKVIAWRPLPEPYIETAGG